MRITEPDWLVADIGGTNIRFGIANAGPSGSPALRQVQSLRVSEFGSLTEAVGNYLLNVDEHVKGAVFGVAGRVVGGVAQGQSSCASSTFIAGNAAAAAARSLIIST